MEQANAIERKLLDAKDLETRLGLGHRTILYFAREGIIPTVRIGRLVRFDLEQVDAWIRAGGTKLLGNWRKDER